MLTRDQFAVANLLVQFRVEMYLEIWTMRHSFQFQHMALSMATIIHSTSTTNQQQQQHQQIWT